MKKITTLAFVLIAFSVNAQWNPSTTSTTASIYREGKVGLNLTSAPVDFLHLGDGANIRLQQRSTTAGATSDINFNVYRDVDPGLIGARIRFSVVDNTATGYPAVWKAGEIMFNTTWGGTEATRLNIKADGMVGVATTTPLSHLQVLDGPWRISLGVVPTTAISQALNWGAQYLGFNMVRTSSAWSSETDGTHNGGAMLMSDRFGNLTFYNAPSAGTQTQAQSLTETDINNRMTVTILSSGNVGIGTNVPDAKLAVVGDVHAKEVRVTTNVPGPDYVFDPEYKLPSLEFVKAYIDRNRHLPEIPSAKEMEENGIRVGEMNLQLLKKVEELTLYIIEQQKNYNDLQAKVTKMEEELEKLKR